MNGKGDSPRNCFSEDFRSNYDQIFRKAPKAKARKALPVGSGKPKPEKPFNGGLWTAAKARKALQRGALEDAVVHHVGSSPRPMAAEVRLDSQRIRS
jgi:hypothetical protein